MQQAKILAAVTLVVTALAAGAFAQTIRGKQPLWGNRVHSQSQNGSAGQGVGNNPFLPIDYPGGIANQNPFAVNDTGKMVGVVLLANGTSKGYLLSGKSFRDVVYPGSTFSAAFGINKSATIVGAYCSDVNCSLSHGFSLSGTTYITLDVPGGMNTNANAVNNSGDVVGFYQTSDSVLHGFMLHQGTYSNIDVPGAIGTSAFGINNQGVIVGSYQTQDFVEHGFILQSGSFTTVDYLGASATQLNSINDSGDAVGTYTLSGDTSNHGLLMTGGVLTSFDVPFPGSISTIPWGVNNHHQIVGSYGSFTPDYFFGFQTTY